MMLLLLPFLYHLMIVRHVLLKLFDLFVQSTSPPSLKTFALLLFILLLRLICLTIFLSLTQSSPLCLIHTPLLKPLLAHLALQSHLLHLKFDLLRPNVPILKQSIENQNHPLIMPISNSNRSLFLK